MPDLRLLSVELDFGPCAYRPGSFLEVASQTTFLLSSRNPLRQITTAADYSFRLLSGALFAPLPSYNFKEKNRSYENV